MTIAGFPVVFTSQPLLIVFTGATRVLRITTSTSPARAKSYFKKGFSREGYYSESQEVIGNWGGVAAERLGLTGEVDGDAFNSLCDNLDPRTGEPLTARTKSNRRVGYDFTFSVPKSVSLLQGITGDERIVKAFREVVHETMLDMECEIRTRVRVGGQDSDRTTGNMVWGEFVHFTARPEQNVADPHLHAHCFAFNATFDEQENRWKAGQFLDIKKDASYFESIFDDRMAARLKELGYEIHRKERSYEIAGVPESAIQQFSKRTSRINEVAAERGITDPKQKDQLGASTRHAKMKDVPLDRLREIWIDEMDPRVYRRILEIQEEAELVCKLQRGFEGSRQTGKVAAGRAFEGPTSDLFGLATAWHGEVEPAFDGALEREAIDFAILHNFERASVVDERKLLETAIRFGVGSIDMEKMKQQLRERPELLWKEAGGRRYTTTHEVVAEETEMIAWVQNGKGGMIPLAPNHIIADTRLNDEQRAAVEHVLTSRDRVIGVNGRAGTGKTTAMKAAIDAIEQNGHEVFVFAPTAEAARDVLAKDFKRAETVAMLLTNERLQKEAQGAVLWIDEAGLLSSRDMSRLAKLANRIDACVVLSGDSRQHRAVERGDGLRILEQHAGLQVATVAQIQRQDGIYREAVADLSNGRIADAFEKLDKLGAIREMDFEDRYRFLAAEYLRARRENTSALVVSPTHSEIRHVNEQIRIGLKGENLLGEERTFTVYRRPSPTEAQRGDVRTYREGWSVEMLYRAGGYEAGQRLSIEAVEPNALLVVDDEGRRSRLDVKRHAKAFEVLRPEEVGIAVGEQIRITKNGDTADGKHRLHNRSLHTVKGFTERGDLILENGWVIDRDYGHIAWGYASTSYTAQGKTVDRVFIAQSSESIGGSNREQFYVSVSRGRTVVIVFTDDREELMAAVHASSERVSATDIGLGDQVKQNRRDVEPGPRRAPSALEFTEQRTEMNTPKFEPNRIQPNIATFPAVAPEHHFTPPQARVPNKKREIKFEMEI